MNFLVLLFKGFIVGIAKIIPGVSGALIAISLGIYEKALKAEKKNRVVEYLLAEHKLENYLLLFLGLFAIELGVILLQGNLLTIPEEAWLIGGKTNTIVFSWVLIGLGAISIVLVASSFYRPSFSEVKHITGLKWKEFLWNVVKVVVFSVVLALFFIGCDFVIEKIIQLLKNLLY